MTLMRSKLYLRSPESGTEKAREDSAPCPRYVRMILSPSLRVTIAFFQFGARPAW